MKPREQLAIDKMHQDACFPHEFNRKVPSLSTLATFKASELKNFLVYTFLPAILPFISGNPDAFHWAALYVEIVRISNQPSIPSGDIDRMHELIRIWQKLIPQMMDAQAQTYSTHALSHLPDQIKRFGAAWAISTFPFESYCGQYSGMIKSGTGVLQQLNRRLPLLKESTYFIRQNSSTDTFLGKLICDLFPLQAKRLVHKNENNRIKVSAVLGQPPGTWNQFLIKCFGAKKLTFSRQLSVNGVLYHSSCNRSGSCLIRGSQILTPSSILEGNYRVCTQFFVFDGEEYFAAAFLYNVLENSICSLAPEPRLPELRKFYRRNPYGSYFKLCALSNKMCLLAVSSIQCKMILFPYDDQRCVLTDMLPFEHD